MSENHIVSRAHPGIVLVDNGTLLWRGETITPVDGIYKTPHGCIDVENLKLLLSLGIVLPPIHWKDVDFAFADGDASNTSRKNIVMMFKNGPVESKDYPGYFYIPFYTSYVINKDGDLINWRRQLKMSTYVADVGYRMFGVTGDDCKRTIVGQHRLLALAFLRYGPDVRKLDVNHIDGVKLNNELKNLEWASRKRNCDHAYQTGLRNDNVIVQVKSVFTNEVFEFYSITECARVFDICHSLVLVRLQSDGQRVYKNGFLFKRKDSKTPWVEVDTTPSHLGMGSISKLRLMKDDFVLETDSYIQAAALTGVLPSTIRWRLDNWPKPVSLNDYKCDLVDMETENKSACAVMRKVCIHQLLEVPESLSTTTWPVTASVKV